MKKLVLALLVGAVVPAAVAEEAAERVTIAVDTHELSLLFSNEPENELISITQKDKKDQSEEVVAPAPQEEAVATQEDTATTQDDVVATQE